MQHHAKYKLSIRKSHKTTLAIQNIKGETYSIKSYTITRSGQCVSVDQLESTTPGLIAQIKAKPTMTRYIAMTVFVDHYERFTYVHIQKSTSAN
jgi:hypothetical protein